MPERKDNDDELSAGERPLRTARFLNWEIVEPRGPEPHTLAELATTTIKFTVEVNEPIRKGHHGTALFDRDHHLMWAGSVDDLKLERGEHEFCHTFPMLPLRPGPYSWLVSLYDDSEELDVQECLPEMIVATEVHQHRYDQWSGFLNLPDRFASNRRG
jgi:hypothetical protein